MSVYFAVTPSDSAALAAPVSQIYVGVSGDVAVVGHDPSANADDGAAVTLKSMPAGWNSLPHPVSKIMSTGTTATNIVAST